MSDPAAAPTRWSLVRSGDAEEYQARFDALEKSGVNVHGEADFVSSLAPARARILDAGCGTGRVASELNRRGFRAVGVDVDAEMIATAHRRDPSTRLVTADLSSLFLRSQTFDIVLLAGNVIPLLAPGTLHVVLRRLADHVHPAGFLMAGFGLDADHVPPGCPITPLRDYDSACEAAGLKPVLRYATWSRKAWTEDSGYVVAVHHPR
ncbi:MAG: class I SAM-dependent methyltransferase [Nostocoides sp.]